ncbi:MAG: hypothetical protein ABL907_24205 [Hyphomicrobium sp.]
MHRNTNMNPPQTVLTTTESRQASPRRMNLRVLVMSLAILAVLGVALTAAFWGSAPQGEAVTPQVTSSPSTTTAPATAPTTAPSPDPAPAPARP